MCPKSKYSLCPDCADTQRFNPQCLSEEQKIQLKRSLGLPLKQTIVSYLGLLTDYQGIPHLIKMAALLKKANEGVHFLVMGYPAVAHYKLLAQKHDVLDMMTFTGKIPYEKAPQYLSLGDISVAPKISTSEGSGKLLNYMAMAQPVVAFDTAVHREYLADFGVYAPVEDVEAFANCILELKNSPEKRQYLGEQLRKRAQRYYSWQQAGLTINQVYKHLTNEGENVRMHVRV